MNAVLRHLSALVIALFTGASPVVLQLCEIHCAEREAAHSCPHEVKPESSVQIAASPHVCAHAADLPTLSSSPRFTQAWDSMAIDLPVPSLLPSPRSVRPATPLSLPPPDPVPLALRTPLRV